MVPISRYVYLGVGVAVAATAVGWSIHVVTKPPDGLRNVAAALSPRAGAATPSAETGSGAAGGYGGVAVTDSASPTSEPSRSSGAGAGGSGSAASTAVGDVTTGLVARKIPDMGAVVTDSNGFVLYRFDKDMNNPPTSRCEAACATRWPPVLSDGRSPTIQGIDPKLVGTVRRADGGTQLTIGGWPLYRYAGDPKAGAWKGQGSGGVWWVIAPNGKKNLTCVPKPTPTTAAPAPTGGSSGTGGSGSGGSGGSGSGGSGGNGSGNGNSDPKHW